MADSLVALPWPIPFWKMSGAGNDFILIDHRKPLVPVGLMAEFTRLACRPKFGAGADGLIFIEDCEDADFRWRFFNADGSEAEMCGNGARCAARFAYMNGIAAARMRFSTLAGLIEARVADTTVTVSLTPPKDLTLNRRVAVEGREYTVHSLNTGVPHAALFLNDADELATVDVRRLGRALRHHPDFGPAGTNVNFVAVAEGGLRVRTYERGVEDETFACGTGATAAALLAAELGLAGEPGAITPVTTTGGVRLGVSFERGNAPYGTVRLQGPAHLIYTGELGPESQLS